MRTEETIAHVTCDICGRHKTNPPNWHKNMYCGIMPRERAIELIRDYPGNIGGQYDDVCDSCHDTINAAIYDTIKKLGGHNAH